jgi:Fur family ferric uptake transcriptional regulator
VVRYDRRTEVHHHLICLRCEDVIDISDKHLDRVRIPDLSDLGFEVSDHRVQLRGICRRCRENQEQEEEES